MKIVVQNLQKRYHLGSDVVEKYDPDMLLAQELRVGGEKVYFSTNLFLGSFGTGIYCKDGKEKIKNIRRVDSPHAEIGGFVWKKTIVANIDGIDFVSFHGYNGFPFKNLQKLIDHVRAAMELLSESGPAVFAGDFNTWTEEHTEAVKACLEELGFRLEFSWKYPSSRQHLILDHVFVREVVAKDFETFSNASDHDGCVFELLM